MISREIQLPLDENILLFGPRNTGKSTLLKSIFKSEFTHTINLLIASQEERFSQDPDQLAAIVKALPETTTHVVIDEIQKAPRLLDVVHQLIEETDKTFVMSGSSARKLKNESANLLAGRAFTYHLHPFTHTELDDQFNLELALNFGLLPSVCNYAEQTKKIKFLQSYARTYLKEEVILEQLVRKIDPFRRFLEVAAQSNGKPLNFTKIGRDVGIQTQTVQQYFSILEDTLLGFYLPAFQHSFRKRLSQQPKFYFADIGIARTLQNLITVPVLPQTFSYGDLFEQFIILECQKYNDYFELDYRFSYLRTQTGAEIDLIIERPGKKTLLIEIKSTDNVRQDHLRHLSSIAEELGNCEAIFLSQDPFEKQYGSIRVYPWKKGLQHLFSNPS